ncbi:hypothetical protein V8F20_004402 [Naviculisporaceae sp. PSN 640]
MVGGGLDGTSRLLSHKTSKGTLSPGDLIRDNVRLQKKVASLQETEKCLKRRNRDLSEYLASLRKEDEASQRAWEEETKAMVSAFQARLNELEELATRQKGRLQAMKNSQRTTSTKEQHPKIQALTIAEIRKWFTARGSIWYGWAEDYAHIDANRLDNVQLCSAVSLFTRLGDDGKLRPELFTNNRINPVQVLLQGMLTNFIINEIIISPLWIFAALNVNRAEFITPNSSPISPISRNNELFAEYLFGAKPMGVSFVEGLPTMPEIERYHDLIVKALGGSNEIHIWRSQLARALTEAGLSQDHMDVPTSKSMRRLVRARRDYAKKLAEDFLSGPACILLRDQAAAGIERMEWKLVNELDAALRLSAQIWSFQTTPLAAAGIEKFGTNFLDSTEMNLCQAQEMDMSIKGGEKHEVIAVLQPEIMAVGAGDEGLDAIWTNAQVFVSPRSVVAAEKAGRHSHSRSVLSGRSVISVHHS